MRTSLKLMALSSIFVLNAPLLADDSPSAPPVKTYKQKMHECMDRQRASNNGMSTQDMKKACDHELQTLENHPSVPPPTDPAKP
jgi:Protein of unknown function (DUF2756)